MVLTKITSSRKKQIETPYFFTVTPIFRIDYTLGSCI
jgi:hypothetical protein